MNSLETIPNELWHTILDLLPPRDRLQTTSSCKFLSEYRRIATLWRDTPLATFLPNLGLTERHSLLERIFARIKLCDRLPTGTLEGLTGFSHRILFYKHRAMIAYLAADPRYQKSGFWDGGKHFLHICTLKPLDRAHIALNSAGHKQIKVIPGPNPIILVQRDQHVQAYTPKLKSLGKIEITRATNSIQKLDKTRQPPDQFFQWRGPCASDERYVLVQHYQGWSNDQPYPTLLTGYRKWTYHKNQWKCVDLGNTWGPWVTISKAIMDNRTYRYVELPNLQGGLRCVKDGSTYNIGDSYNHNTALITLNFPAEGRPLVLMQHRGRPICWYRLRPDKQAELVAQGTERGNLLDASLNASGLYVWFLSRLARGKETRITWVCYPPAPLTVDNARTIQKREASDHASSSTSS